MAAMSMRTWTARGVIGALGIGLAGLAAPLAVADPDVAPDDSPAPLAMVAPVDPVLAAASPAAPAPEGVPHLPSPDSLPPGTTSTPAEGRTMGYFRDLWHAVRTQDVTMSDAVLLFAQRPMDANAPLAQMSPHNDPVVADGAIVAPPAADLPVAAEPAP